MHTAKVDNEHTVQVDPHVIVANERKCIARLVDEVGVDLGREVVVVRVALVAKALAVQWKVVVVDVRVDTHRRVVGRQRDAIQLQIQIDGKVDTGHVAEPLVKVGLRGRGWRRAGKDWLAVGANERLHNAQIQTKRRAILKVGMRLLEVADCHAQRQQSRRRVHHHFVARARRIAVDAHATGACVHRAVAAVIAVQRRIDTRGLNALGYGAQ